MLEYSVAWMVESAVKGVPGVAMGRRSKMCMVKDRIGRCRIGGVSKGKFR